MGREEEEGGVINRGKEALEPFCSGLTLKIFILHTCSLWRHLIRTETTQAWSIQAPRCSSDMLIHNRLLPVIPKTQLQWATKAGLLGEAVLCSRGLGCVGEEEREKGDRAEVCPTLLQFVEAFISGARDSTHILSPEATTPC